MTVVQRIHPASAFKIGLVVYGFLGLILGAVCTLASIAGNLFFGRVHAAFGLFGMYVGVFAIVLCPVIYGLFGGVGAAIGALIYNLASDWIGGLEIEMTSSAHESATLSHVDD